MMKKTTKSPSLRRANGPLSKNQESKKVLHRNLEALVQRSDLLARQFGGMAKSLETIWGNQKELSKSESLLDEQFAVLTRMTISTLNQIIEHPGKAQPITYEDVNRLFKDWADFRKRSDFREHMRAWFMGDDLASLPPPPVEEPGKPADQPKEGESNVPSVSAEENDRQERPASGRDGQEAEVSEVRKDDNSPVSN